ncbi:MAG: hypothetical protein P9X24_11925 [Candidatus Hatepunaea meridiana]|nr:hypothetical protein [Candidatus Hatepunaea meridiana]
MHPGGNHHHYSCYLTTQDLPEDSSGTEIWWNNRITDSIIPTIQQIVDQHNSSGNYRGRDAAWIQLRSGFRCPIRNKSSQVKGANNSPHLMGAAVDHKILWDSQDLNIDADRRRLSKITYQIFFKYDSLLFQGGYLYGVRINSDGTAVNSGSSRLRDNRFWNKDGQRRYTYPPNPTEVRHLWYVWSAGDTTKVVMTRGHSDWFPNKKRRR